jgi:hypothetical protein
MKRGRNSGDVVDVVDLELESVRPSSSSMSVPDVAAQREAQQTALSPRASLGIAVRGERALYGDAAFFARAADELFTSTQLGLELAGAVYARTVAERTLCVGLSRQITGSPGRVAIDPQWGSLLWHTHPGLRGSLAAFSNEDLDVAKQTGKPLLVIGFGGLSPDVVTTLTLPMGVRGFLLSSGLKGILSLEKHGHLQRRLLALGVAARVCYPSGVIQPVLRQHATPFMAALDDVSSTVDRGMGAVERAGQRALRKVITTLRGK